MPGIKKAGVKVSARDDINLIEGANVTLTVSEHDTSGAAPHDDDNQVDITIDASGAAGVTDHGALTGLADDDHPQYTTAAEATVIADTEADARVATHAGLADPHTGYQKESEKDAVNGYPGLSAAGFVVPGELGSGTPTSAKFLRGDGAWTVHDNTGDPHSQYATDTDLTTHAAAADPHTGYRLESEDHTHASSGLQGGVLPTTTATLFIGVGASMWIETTPAVPAHSGTAPDETMHFTYTDAATVGVDFLFAVPFDWASGAITYVIYYGVSATDANATHTIRWSMDVKEIASAASAIAAGTTTAFTGAAIARTQDFHYKETSQTLLTPSAAEATIRCNLRRVGADGADTYVGNIRLFGVQLKYTANR